MAAVALALLLGVTAWVWRLADAAERADRGWRR